MNGKTTVSAFCLNTGVGGVIFGERERQRVIVCLSFLFFFILKLSLLPDTTIILFSQDAWKLVKNTHDKT